MKQTFTLYGNPSTPHKHTEESKKPEAHLTYFTRKEREDLRACDF